MNAEQNELARRFVACNGWVWLPGIRAVWGHGCGAGMRIVGVDAWCVVVAFPQNLFSPLRRIARAEVLPDLTDAMTRAGLLEVVRRAWGDEMAFCRPVDEDDGALLALGAIPGWQVFAGNAIAWGRTELAALLAALEAAP